MRRFIFLGLLIGFWIIAFPKGVLAEGEFGSSYNVSYDVDSSGITTVNEKVDLKNLTERYYASSFTLTIGSTNVFEVFASDNQSQLDTQVTKEGTDTKITVKFGQQIVGLGKIYSWSLKYKSRDFAQSQGKVWQVTVPRISSKTNVESYNLTLSVPAEFDSPTSIIPEPKSQSETNGKINFSFTKDQLINTGILANFGSNQEFSFNMTYDLRNEGALPIIYKVALPSNTNFQQVVLTKIDPKPENVLIDNDGNYIGLFRLEARQQEKLNVEGLTKLSLTSTLKTPEILPDSQLVSYTKTDKYWDKDNPIIKLKLGEIFKNSKAQTNVEKARLINQYVVDNLKYDVSRLKNQNFDRLGGVTVLSNPDQALCSEFTDLFITLARAVNIPTRQLIGYAYTTNSDLRPLSFGKSVLHSWPEYYDPALGWVMIDPTWQNTTGGVDYFSKFDLNHFVLAVRGESSEIPSTADDVKVNFSSVNFVGEGSLNANVEVSKEIFAGLPSRLTVTVYNQGNFITGINDFKVNSARLKIVPNSSFSLPPIPPGGHIDYDFSLNSNSLFSSFNDVLEVRVGTQLITYPILVKPFFAFRVFPFAMGGLFVLISGLYGLILWIHLKNKSFTSFGDSIKKSS